MLSYSVKLAKYGAVGAMALLMATYELCANAVPQKSTYWVIDNVHTESQGADAVVAREKALIAGQRRAFEELLALLPIQDTDKRALANAKDEEILPLIFDFSVQDEQLAPGKYRALLRYRFPKDVVARWLERKHVAMQTPLDQESALDQALAEALRGEGTSHPLAEVEASGSPQDSAQETYVEIPVARLADWFSIEKKLQDLRGTYHLYSYSARWVVLLVSQQFLKAHDTFLQHGIILDQADSMWRLSCTSTH
jgi:hypothetical protein